MYAVIKTGGKQYRVAPDDIIKVEKLPGEAGAKVEFDTILMVGGEEEPLIGTPNVDGAKVSGEILEQARSAKIIVFKKKRRQNYRRKKGHRQELTVIRITEIEAGGKKATGEKKAKASKAKKPAAKKTTAKKDEIKEKNQAGQD